MQKYRLLLFVFCMGALLGNENVIVGQSSQPANRSIALMLERPGEDIIINAPLLAASIEQFEQSALRELTVHNIDAEALEALSRLEEIERLTLFGGSLRGQRIEGLPKLRSLTLTNCEMDNLIPLQGCPHLESLTINYRSRPANLNGAASLQGLREIHVLATEISNVSELAAIPNLNSVSLQANREEIDLRPLSDTGILSLHLAGAASFVGLNELRTLTTLSLEHTMRPELLTFDGLDQLNSLELSGRVGISDLVSLTQLPNLRKLVLSKCPEIRNIESLRSLNDLSSLTIISCDEIQDIRFIADLISLENLELTLGYSSDAADLKVLEHCQARLKLRLDREATVEDIEALSKIAKLESLSLYFSEISEMPNLDALENTSDVSIFIASSDIRDLSPLSSLTSIRSLTFQNCDLIQNVQSLQNLSRLVSLAFSDCDGKIDLAPLSQLHQLRSLNIEQCDNIMNIGGLEGLYDLENIVLPSSITSEELRGLVDSGVLNPRLASLTFRNVRNVSDWSPLAELVGLESLSFYSCSGLANVGFLEDLIRLQTLEFVSSPDFHDLTPASGLGLITLRVQSCPLFRSLAALDAMQTLYSLNCQYCDSVSELEPLLSLEGLQGVDFAFCTGIEDLSPFASWSGVRSINVEGCVHLAEEDIYFLREASTGLSIVGPEVVQ